ncbi:5-dehydro-2-deoxygluconokinase [Actinacidiphila paucisporea]|uniref:5-dehydro-2-deoxygluconokinase n=1 Tax=Actinacidiphila paucisporea TaxID=310782 RepID=UPI0009364C8E|nr:5-dehydro-2-deoxygluconokinase [Actinacidiphila paucisporea]
MRTQGRAGGEEPAGAPYDVVTLGRVGVDLYPEQSGIGLAEVRSFAKYLGGTAGNVAVAAARLGLSTAVLSAVGPDPFGDFVRTALTAFGVDTRLLATVPGTQTPVVFCELFPPDDFPIHFYRRPVAPDECLTPDHLPAAVRTARALWITGSALAVEPTRSTVFAALEARAGGEVWFDLDWRPGFWADPAEAPALYARALAYATLAVGNRAEVEVAVGSADPETAAGLLLRRGVRTAVVKQGPAGALVRTAGESYVAPPMPVKVVNGLGAGDAFGGALCAGLIAGDPLPEVLRAANAAGAIVASRLACADAMPTRAEIDAMLHERSAPGGGTGAAPRLAEDRAPGPDADPSDGTSDPHPGVDLV